MIKQSTKGVKVKKSCKNCRFNCKLKNIWEKGDCLGWREKLTESEVVK